MNCPIELDLDREASTANWHVREGFAGGHARIAMGGPNPLERLAQLVLANDRLMDELAVSRSRIVAAREYLDRPGCNARFGEAHLARSRAKHSGVLAQLRANRIEALTLLGDTRSGTRPAA